MKRFIKRNNSFWLLKRYSRKPLSLLFRENHWHRIQSGKHTVLSHKGQTLQPNQHAGIVSTATWSELKKHSDLLDQAATIFHVFQGLSLINEEMLGVYFMSPKLFSYEAHHSDKNHAFTQNSKIQDSLQSQPSANHAHLSSRWILDKHNQSLLLIHTMMRDQIEQHVAIEIDLSKRLHAIQKQLANFGYADLHTKQPSQEILWQTATQSLGNMSIESDLSTSHSLSDSYTAFHHQVYPFQNLPWTFTTNTSQYQAFSHLFLKLCACFLICISILVLLLSFVHRLYLHFLY